MSAAGLPCPLPGEEARWPNDVTLDALSGSWRIHQRRAGHRWSIDDLLVAHQACNVAPAARNHLDLGCGIGSVLLMVAYRLRHATHVGVEAQEQSFVLARANVAHNGVDNRTTLVNADFREWSSAERFDVVTGSPPYLPVGTATRPRDDQKAHARLEIRGGIEAYCEAAARHVQPDGWVVLCGDGRRPERTRAAATAVGLHVHHWMELIPLVGKPPLLHVVRLAPRPPATETRSELLARTEQRKRTPELQAIRASFDMPPMPDDLP